MPKITRKPHEVEAMVVTTDNMNSVKSFATESFKVDENSGLPYIDGINGSMECEPGVMLVIQDTGLEAFEPDEFLNVFDVNDDVKASMEKHWNKKQREEAPSSDWAVPEKNKLRIDDAKHVKLAWAMVGRTKDLTDKERKEARKRILAKAKKFDIDTSDWVGVSKESLEDTAGVEDIVETVAIAPVIPGPSDGVAYLLAIVAEEAGESVQALVHAIRYGIDCQDTKHPGKTPRDEICCELNQLLAAMYILNDELTDRGVEPIHFGKGHGLDEAISDRLESLRNEYQAGRYTLPTSNS